MNASDPLDTVPGVTEQRIAPYGEWVSPIDATQVAVGSRTPVDAHRVRGEVWWSEPVAAERVVTLMREHDGRAERVLGGGWNLRSSVHEYGGGAWATDGERVALVHGGDQRLHRLDGPGAEPVPLTPAALPFRFGGLVLARDAVLAVRETITGDGPSDVQRDLVAVPLDGSAADDASAIVSVVAGSRFLAQPAVSPDGRSLAWIAWDHPNMPWDGTELRVGALVDGRVPEWRRVLGGAAESVVQPLWRDDATLLALSDSGGWWNLVQVPVAGGDALPLRPEARETGGPLWVLDQRWMLPAGPDRLVVVSTLGAQELRLLDLASGADRVLRFDRAFTRLAAVDGDLLLVIDEAAGDPAALREIDLATGASRVVRAGVEGVPAGLLPAAEPVLIDGVHAFVYRPRNPAYRAPVGELPPFVALVHGGPTSQTGPRASPSIAYYTSRGIGVADIDYGGSTGYGRTYRERLRGQWGVVDVADVVAVMRGLGERGVADPGRLAIEGGSAGGWTVLAALTGTDVFACGVSRYGVAELVTFATTTHDFESRYLDGLIGPWPEARDVYEQRAPLNHVDGLAVPVLLLQGLDDRVVPPEQSRLFRDALASRRIPHALIEYPGEGHGFRGRDAQISALEASVSFYGQVLGFTPPGVPALALQQ